MSHTVSRTPRFVVDSAILRFLAAGREIRTVPAGRTRAVEVGWVDAVAGSEYLDDRLRLQGDQPPAEP